MSFFGKVHEISRFFGREYSVALGGFSNTNFASGENIGHVCLDPAQKSPRFSLFFARRLTYWLKSTLVAMAKARTEKKRAAQKLEKHYLFIYLERNAQSQIRAGV